MKTFFIWFGGIATVLGLFLFVVAVSSWPKETGSRVQRQPPLDTGVDAFYISKQFIRDRLKSPSTAKFPNPFDEDGSVKIMTISNGYRVVAWVDAQNAFGAMLRKPYICEVSEESTKPGYWKVIGTCGLVE